MKNIDEEFIDASILHEGFNLSTLYAFQDDLIDLKNTLEQLRDAAIEMRDKKEAVDAERKLYYLNGNIEVVRSVIETKEMDIFQFSRYGDICLN